MTHTHRQRASARHALPLAALAVAIVAAVFLARHEPTSVGAIPPCPLHAAGGATCPGCGSLRAAHHALNGRLATAFRYNPALIVLGAPAAGLFAAGLLGYRPRLHARAERALAWIILGAILLYFAARNIPAFDWLRPPP